MLSDKVISKVVKQHFIFTDNAKKIDFMLNLEDSNITRLLHNFPSAFSFLLKCCVFLLLH